MTTDSEQNTCTPSTIWVWKQVKMRRPAGGPRDSAAEPLHRLSERDPREPLTITVVYRGGPECWWELRARGRVYRRPGTTALHDVLEDINLGVTGRQAPTRSTGL